MKSNVVVYLILSLGLLWAPSSRAQDVLGLWFDSGGTIDRATTTAPNEIVTAYLIIQDPSRTTGVDSWECQVEVASDGPATFVSWSLQGSAANAASPPSFFVGLGSPLPSTDDVLLATAMIVVPEAGQKVRLLVLPMNPPSLQDPDGEGYPVHRPLYGSADELVPLELSSGCIGGAAAVINDDGVAEPYGLELDEAVFFEPGEEVQNRTTFFANGGATPVGGLVHLEGDGFTYRLDGGSVTTSDTWFRLDSGEEIAVQVTFDPTQAEVVDGRLRIATCGGERVIELTDGDPYALCRVEPAAINLGTTPPDYWSNSLITVYNEGYADLTVDFEVDNPAFHFYYKNGFPIPPGFTGNVRVYLPPNEYGIYEGNISFKSNADCGETIPVWGAIVDETPGCEVSPQPLSLAAVTNVGFDLETVRLWNSGEEPVSGVVGLPAGCEPFNIVQGTGHFHLEQFEYHDVQIMFEPTQIGWVHCEIPTGTDCGNIVLKGRGLNPVPSCSVQPDTLDFGIREVGNLAVMAVEVLNDGNVGLVLDPVTDGGVFSTEDPPGYIDLPSGGSVLVNVTMNTMTQGNFEGRLEFGPPYCGEAVLRGSVVPDGDPLNEIGIFFDQGFEVNRFHVPGFSGPLTGYLVLMNPRYLGEAIGEWECCVTVRGDPVATTWVPQGRVVNNRLQPPCFDVDVTDPPPTFNPTVLAVMNMFIDENHSVTQYYLDPIPDPTLPGRIAYRTSRGWFNVFTHTGERWVASLNSDMMTPVELPAPRVALDDGRVHLTWSYFGDEADGFHVYRRIGQGAESRLTPSPVTGTGGSFDFTDKPDVFGPAQLTYVCAAVKAGLEIARGPEVTVSFGGQPRPLTLALKPNYPNPFNPSTTVPFEIAKAGRVRLTVFDLAGRQVAVLVDAEYGVGYHEEVWLGKDTAGRQVPSGPYYLRIESGGLVRMRQMMMLK